MLLAFDICVLGFRTFKTDISNEIQVYVGIHIYSCKLPSEFHRKNATLCMISDGIYVVQSSCHFKTNVLVRGLYHLPSDSEFPFLLCSFPSMYAVRSGNILILPKHNYMIPLYNKTTTFTVDSKLKVKQMIFYNV